MTAGAARAREGPPDGYGVPAEVGLLEQALAYTGPRLGAVREDHLTLPTPCCDWDLAALLAHMEDALDAFAEAAAGFVVPLPPARLPQHPVARVPVLHAKACALLGSWARPTLPHVRTGSRWIEAPVLVATAALEITVHGWDVAAALAHAAGTGPAAPPPDALAGPLLRVAVAGVPPRERGHRFAPAVPPPFDASYGERLLAYLGRPPLGC